MPMISLQVSQELMDQFDAVWSKLAFPSRSEALRESILYFIQHHQESIPLEGHRVAIITMQHELREDILDKFTDLIRKYEHLVKSVNQYNLKNNMIKSLIVAGPADEINDFYSLLEIDRLFTCSISYIIVATEEVDKKELPSEPESKLNTSKK